MRRVFPLSLVRTKGQLYDVEGLFKSYTKLTKADTPTLNAKMLGTNKASFENAVNAFLIGMGTKQGLLPKMEEQVFERELIDSVLDLRNSGHRIECNHSEKGH